MSYEKYELEYVWLDGYQPANLRSKVKIFKSKEPISLKNIPSWNFDGSSTRQAPGDNSECLLKPVRLYSVWSNRFIVFCEVQNADGTDHDSNHRSKLRRILNSSGDDTFWFGFEQEYFITKDFMPLGFPQGGYPRPQGLYYCGVGSNQTSGRRLVLGHMRECLELGMDITGINAEVAVGQWEYQCFSDDALKACDDLWISRYLLYQESERYGWDIDISPKPVKGDWNGSGCHANFSNKKMREAGTREYYYKIFTSLHERHKKHIDGYGENNHERLTGQHETQSIDLFSWGIADRGASIRVPTETYKADWNGYLEDRRPASNCDPYKVAGLIIEAVTNI